MNFESVVTKMNALPKPPSENRPPFALERADCCWLFAKVRGATVVSASRPCGGAPRTGKSGGLWSRLSGSKEGRRGLTTQAAAQNRFPAGHYTEVAHFQSLRVFPAAGLAVKAMYKHGGRGRWSDPATSAHWCADMGGSGVRRGGGGGESPVVRGARRVRGGGRCPAAPPSVACRSTAVPCRFPVGSSRPVSGRLLSAASQLDPLCWFPTGSFQLASPSLPSRQVSGWSPSAGFPPAPLDCGS